MARTRGLLTMNLPSNGIKWVLTICFKILQHGVNIVSPCTSVTPPGRNGVQPVEAGRIESVVSDAHKSPKGVGSGRDRQRTSRCGSKAARAEQLTYRCLRSTQYDAAQEGRRKAGFQGRPFGRWRAIVVWSEGVPRYFQGRTLAVGAVFPRSWKSSRWPRDLIGFAETARSSSARCARNGREAPISQASACFMAGSDSIASPHINGACHHARFDAFAIANSEARVSSRSSEAGKLAR